MTRVVLRSHGRTASLGWLALGLLFGAPLLAVGLQPGGKPINLVVGIPVFGGFLGLAFWDLGRSDVLVLDVDRRRGLFHAGWFHRRSEVEFGFDDVLRLVLVRSLVTTGGKSSSHAMYFDLRLELRDRRALVLPLGRRHDADDLAVRAARALGRRVDQETVAGHGP